MAWIESHQTLRDHPKTRKLARLLDVSLAAAIGHLHCLWWWGLEYASDGDLSKYAVSEIAAGAIWGSDPVEFVDALCEAGFLDREDNRLAVHDWMDYAGRLVTARERKALDMKKRRASTLSARCQHVVGTLPARNENVTLPTVPNRTVPNRTVPPPVSSPIEMAATPPAAQPENSGAKVKSPRVSRKAEVDEPFREKMRQRFRETFGDTVDERIDGALGYKSADKYNDLQAYVTNWLRRDAERIAAAGGAQHGGANGVSEVDTGPVNGEPDYTSDTPIRRAAREQARARGRVYTGPGPGYVPPLPGETVVRNGAADEPPETG